MRVGIDIGGTKTEAVALDGGGAVVGTVRLPTGFGTDEVIDSAMTALHRLGPVESVQSVGVGIPGAVDSRTGRVEHAVNLGLVGLELGAELRERIGRPVRIENDVNAAALGAFSRLGLGEHDSLAYLNLGTGLAAGIVLGGRLWRGSRGVAGEIGHIPVDPDGELCRCGQRGCLELTASGSAVARAWPVESGWPVRALFDAADAGDPRAVDVRDAFADRVAAAVRILVLTVDPDRVVIGAGLSSLGDELLDVVRQALAAQAESSPFIASQRLPERVGLVPADVPIAAVGAALAGEA